MLAERLADLRARHRPTAQRNDLWRAVPERLERGLLLAHPELDLAPLREDLRDRLAQLALDLAVEVDESPAQALGDLQAERRLAGAHEADEGEVAV